MASISFSIVAVGHVDHGKSTLIGCILQDMGQLDDREIEKNALDAEKSGAGKDRGKSFALDILEEERERGKTFQYDTKNIKIDDTHQIQLIDCPGHRGFISEMIAGSSFAQMALIVVSARSGEFEAGLNGQTKEHCLLIKTLGIKNIMIVVNKMDCIEWNQERYTEICNQMKQIVSRYKFPSVSFIPISAVNNLNIVSNDGCPWYTDMPLIPTIISYAKSYIPTPVTYEPPTECNKFIATLMFVTDLLIVPGALYVIHIGTQIVEAVLTKIALDDKTIKFINNQESKPTTLKCKFELKNTTLCAKNDRIIIRDADKTIAIGKIN